MFGKSEVRQLRAQLARQQGLTDAAQVRADQAQTRWRDAVDTGGQLLADWQQAQRDIVKLREDIDHAHHALRWRDDQITDLQHQAAQLAGQNSTQAEELGQLQQAYAGLRARAEGADTMAREERAARAMAESQVSTLNQQLQHATWALQQAQETIATVSRDNDHLARVKHVMVTALSEAAQAGGDARGVLTQVSTTLTEDMGAPLAGALLAVGVDLAGDVDHVDQAARAFVDGFIPAPVIGAISGRPAQRPAEIEHTAAQAPQPAQPSPSIEGQV